MPAWSLVLIPGDPNQVLYYRRRVVSMFTSFEPVFLNVIISLHSSVIGVCSTFICLFLLEGVCTQRGDRERGAHPVGNGYTITSPSRL